MYIKDMSGGGTWKLLRELSELHKTEWVPEEHLWALLKEYGVSRQLFELIVEELEDKRLIYRREFSNEDLT